MKISFKKLNNKYYNFLPLILLIITIQTVFCNENLSNISLLENISKISLGDNYIDDSNYNKNDYTNVIKNGDFESQRIKNKSDILSTLHHWKIVSTVKVLDGHHYNKNWNSGQVYDISNSKSLNIKQSFVLSQPTHCIVEFDYASLTKNNKSTLSVLLNDKQIYLGNPNDLNFYNYSKKLNCIKGKNTIEFANASNKKRKGITIDNVKVLIPKELEDTQQEIIQDEVEDESNIEDNKNVVYKNIIKNGDFEKPKLSKKKDVLEDIPNWYAKPNAEIGLGYNYHKNWRSGQVIDLHAKTNTSIQQEFVLNEEAKCTLKFDYLAPKGQKSSAIIVELNNEVILFTSVFNTNINKFEKQLLCKKGINSLVFKGQGDSKSKGMTVDNIELLVPEEVEVAEFENNLIKNGNFELPNINEKKDIINDVPNWIIEPNAHLGIGKKFNSKWLSGQGQVANLFTNQNSSLSQVFDMEEANFCKVKFQFAVEGSVKTTSMKVYLNDKLIYTGSPLSKNINYFNKIYVCKKGENKILFKGTSTKKKGVTIDNVEVLMDESFELNNNDSEVDIGDDLDNFLKNGYFELPNITTKNEILNKVDNWFYSEDLKLGQGTLFNKNLISGQAVEIGNDEKSYITQVFFLEDPVLCLIKFNCISKNNNNYLQLKAVFNNEVIFDSMCSNKETQYFSNISVCQNGNNIIKFEANKNDKNTILLDNVGIYPLDLETIQKCLIG